VSAARAFSAAVMRRIERGLALPSRSIRLK
jgi:hypothetical protein